MTREENCISPETGLSPADMDDFLQAVCDWAFILDGEYRITYCFKALSATGNLLPANLLGRPFALCLPESCRSEVMEQLGQQNYIKGIRHRIAYRDPYIGNYILHTFPRFGGSGFEGCKVLITRLQTDMQKSSKNEPSDSDALLRQQELLTAVSMEAATGKNPHALLNYITKRLGAFLKVDRCTVFRHDMNRKTYSCLYDWCAPGIPSVKHLLQDIPYNEEDEGYLQLITRPYIAVDDTFRYTGEAYRIQREAGVHAFIDLPILANGLFWGFLGADVSSGPRHWTENEFHLLQTIGNIISTALEKHHIQDQLHNAFTQMEQIVRNYPGIIFSINTENRFTLCEGAALQKLINEKSIPVGSAQELLGEDFHILGEMGLSGKALGHLEKTPEEGPQSFYLDWHNRHFTCETLGLQARDGSKDGFVAAALDVTDMKNMQQNLERAIENAKEASKAKSDFLSRMSHEIRTPMNAIIGMNTLAKKTDNMERMQYCLDKIDIASHQLLSLINDILDLSKIEAGKLEIVHTQFDFEKMLQNIFNVMQGRMDEKNQQFSFVFNGDMSRYIVSDELRLSQVILNLLSNAVKFTPENGVIQLLVRLKETGSGRVRIRVGVKDTGIGISPEEQKRLFHSFEQADGSISRKFGGTGLGLSICREIMELMGGKIWVSSRPGEGALFTFEVDAQLGEEKLSEKESETLPENLKVLVIDDNFDVLVYFQNVLQSFHIACDVASGGAKGLEMIKNASQTGDPYDLVFLDWHMPEMNGAETARRIKQAVQDKIIVVTISVADRSDIETEARQIGITRFLSKPVLPSVLFDTMLSLTRQNGRNIPAPPKTVRNWNGKRLLLAEDIDINREIVSSILEPLGITVDCAADGKEAVEKFRRAPGGYDLILMDVQMPVMDGLHATEEIRKEETDRVSPIPIIAMTANAFTEDVQKCLDCGMNDHVAKPIDIDVLLEKLAGYLP